MFFAYGDREIEHLKRRDRRMGAAMEAIGPVRRETDPDLFSAVVHHIMAQQISTRAQETIWRRIREALGTVDAAHILAFGPSALQALGMSFRKAAYIVDFAQKVAEGIFPLESVAAMPDEEAVRSLVSLRGIGVWTAEMILLFCLQRPNVFSFDDLAIRRGLRMLYRHREMGRERFERYRRRFSPCCSVASLYLWEIAGGALPGLRDPGESVTAGTAQRRGRGGAR